MEFKVFMKISVPVYEDINGELFLDHHQPIGVKAYRVHATDEKAAEEAGKKRALADFPARDDVSFSDIQVYPVFRKETLGSLFPEVFEKLRRAA